MRRLMLTTAERHDFDFGDKSFDNSTDNTIDDSDDNDDEHNNPHTVHIQAWAKSLGWTIFRSLGL